MKWKISIYHFVFLILANVHGNAWEESFSPAEAVVRARGAIYRKQHLGRENSRLFRQLIENTRLFQKSRLRPFWWATTDESEDVWGNREKVRRRRPTRPKHKKRVHQFADVNFDNSTAACCPQNLQVIDLQFGRTLDGGIVHLYHNDKIQQKFYEYRCSPGVEGSPCQFLDGKNHKMSKCTQTYSYQYALLEANTTSSGWSLDYIRIGSGCVCRVYESSEYPKVKRKKHFDIDRRPW